MQQMQDDPRTRVQLDAILAWIESEKKGTVVLAPGFGKTRVGCIVVGEQLRKGKIKNALVVVPRIPLIEQWKKEFEKWGYNTDNVDIMCIQTAYKLDAHYDILVVDEAHRSVSPKFKDLYVNIKYEQVLGLTGTAPEDAEYRELLEAIAPIVFTKTVDEALEIDAISNYIIYNLAVPMSKKNRARYRKFDSMLKRAQLEIGMLKRYDEELRTISIFDIAKKWSTFTTKDPLVKWSKQYWAAMSMRKWECYQNEAKIPVVKQIIDKFPAKKWIIFNKSIKFAEAIKEAVPNSEVYHSKMNTEDREKVLENFRTNKTRYLIAVDALNEGLNVPDADGAICVSGVSKQLVQQQTLGRVTRHRPDKTALYINLVSNSTVEESWVKKRVAGIKNVRWINNLNAIK